MSGMVWLSESEWTARADTHTARVRRWTRPHLERQRRGVRHPVLDFLFTYYSHRPSHLERWQPGLGVVLLGDAAERFLGRSGYVRRGEGVTLDISALTPARADAARRALVLLRNTASRPPQLDCFGLHEWAMVYRQPAADARHATVPLRLGRAGTDAIVESRPLRCSHYDAFRFFTEPARPRNAATPTRASQPSLEQPGCLHANMDLYRWAYKLGAFVPADLVADCFELAARIRELDMRASPYDLSEFGYSPVRIETPAGRAEYARAQAAFATDAAPLRTRLVNHYREVLARYSRWTNQSPG